MPNWTYNRIQGPKKVLDSLLDKDRKITFETLLPQPPEIKELDKVNNNDLLKAFRRYYLDDFESDLKDYYSKMHSDKSFDEFVDSLYHDYPLDIVQLSQDAISKYGCDNWYDWRCKYWGCKWNANPLNEGPVDKDACELEFETPWSPPEGIIRLLAEKFPNEDWKWHADEESCAFSIDYYPDGSGGLHEEDVDPEFYLPYFPDNEKDFMADFENLTSKSDILSQINITLPDMVYREVKCDEKAKTIQVTVYNYESYGGEELYTVVFNYSE